MGLDTGVRTDALDAKASHLLQRLHLASTVTIAAGMIVVLLSAFGLLTGTWLIAGVGLVLAGMAKAIVFSVWNGLTV